LSYYQIFFKKFSDLKNVTVFFLPFCVVQLVKFSFQLTKNFIACSSFSINLERTAHGGVAWSSGKKVGDFVWLCDYYTGTARKKNNGAERNEIDKSVHPTRLAVRDK
jgi:hypothetical protein